MSKRHVVWDYRLRAWRDKRTGHYWVYHHMPGSWMMYAVDEMEYLRGQITYRCSP